MASVGFQSASGSVKVIPDSKFQIPSSRFQIMEKIKQFEDLEVWNNARKVANLIYDITSIGQFSQDYGLRDQIRRAAVSVFSNIAEGFERDNNKEFIQYLTIAKGSCGEVRAQLIFAIDHEYITIKEFEIIKEKLLETSRQLSGFIKYLRTSDLRGRKHN